MTISSVLQHLELERSRCDRCARLTNAINALKLLKKDSLRGAKPRSDSTRAKVESFLSTVKESTFSIRAIAEQTNTNPLRVRNELCKLVDKGVIRRVKQGLYAK